MIRVTDMIAIDEREIEERFVRASGPGGQKVNKTSSAVELRFDARRSPSLPDDVRARLYRLAAGRLTQDGVIVIFAQRFRDQMMNRQDARDRLIALIQRANEPLKSRCKTRPTHGAKLQRLEGKSRRSETKARRSKPQIE